MKLNWGWSIIIVFALFVIFILAFVYRASQEKLEFVTDNYYEKELKFQDQINTEKNSLALSEDIKVNLLQQEKMIKIKYPDAFDTAKISGDIIFFKPDNSGFDFNVPVKCDGKHCQQINSSKMQHGRWNVKISWMAEGKPYYYEERILIN